MRRGRWLEFVNNTGETIPAFGAVMLDEAGAEKDILPGGSGYRFIIDAKKPAGGIGLGKTGLGKSDEVVGFSFRSITGGTYTISWNPGGLVTGGTYTISWNPGTGVETTSAINYDATAATVLLALLALPSSTAGDFLVTGEAGPEGTIQIEFTGTYALTNVNEITVNVGSLTGDTSQLTITTTQQGTGSVNEKQTFDLDGAGATVETTTAIAFDATSATVQAALEALTTPTAGDFAVTGGPGPDNIFTIQYKGNYALTNVNEITIDSTNLTGNKSQVTIETTQAGGPFSNERQTFDLTGTPSGTYTLTHNGLTTLAIDYTDTAGQIQSALRLLGSFTISWNPGGGVETTAALAWNSTTAQVLTALEALPTALAGDFAVTGGLPGSVFTIEFKGTYALTNVNQITISSTNSSGKSLAATIATTVPGTGAVNEEQTFNLNATTTGDIWVYGGFCTLFTDAANYYVVFRGSLGGIDPGDITIDDTNMLGIDVLGPTIHQAGGGSSADDFYLIDLDDALSGQFTITLDRKITANIEWDALDTGVTDALEALLIITVGDIDTFSGHEAADSGSRYSGMWAVRFGGTFANKRIKTSRGPTISVLALSTMNKISRGLADGPHSDVGFIRFASHIALNGEIPVADGEKGLCTLDTPAYGLISDKYFFEDDKNPRAVADAPDTSDHLTIALPLNDQWYLQATSHTNGLVAVPALLTDDDWPGLTDLTDVWRIVFLSDITTSVADTRVALLMREDRV